MQHFLLIREHSCSQDVLFVAAAVFKCLLCALHKESTVTRDDANARNYPSSLNVVTLCQTISAFSACRFLLIMYTLCRKVEVKYDIKINKRD